MLCRENVLNVGGVERGVERTAAAVDVGADDQQLCGGSQIGDVLLVLVDATFHPADAVFEISSSAWRFTRTKSRISSLAFAAIVFVGVLFVFFGVLDGVGLRGGVNRNQPESRDQEQRKDRGDVAYIP